MSAEMQIDSRLEARQPQSFNQLAADLAKAKCSPIIAESVACHQAQTDIGQARTIAVASIQAKVQRPAYRKGPEVLVREECGCSDLHQNVDSRKRCRIAHQRQLGEILDRTALKPRADA